MGFIHTNYAPFTRKGILIVPYISLTNKKNSKESLTTIFCTVIIHLYSSFNRKNYGCHDDTVTDIHRQSQARNGVLVYRIVQNCTEHLSHNYTTMTVTKTNVTTSLTQPNNVSLDCQVFRLPFWMAWQYYGS